MSNIPDLVGKKFHYWTVKEFAGRAKDSKRLWLCSCKCGETKVVRERALTSGHAKSCGCWNRELIERKKLDIIGKRFGMLEVKEFAGMVTVSKAGKQMSTYLCSCDCGQTTIVKRHYLTIGDTKSCGCLVKETAIKNGQTTTKHGHCSKLTYNRRSRTFVSWEQMRTRCYNSNNASYKRYGARGIKVCDRWRNSFENFLADMGERPEGMTLDRIDFDKDYCPENCRWATIKEQNTNRSNVWSIEFDGDRDSIADWAEFLGLHHSTIRWRINMGRAPLIEVSEEKLPVFRGNKRIDY